LRASVGPLAPNREIVQIHLGLSHPAGVLSGLIGSSLDKIWHIHADVPPHATMHMVGSTARLKLVMLP